MNVVLILTLCIAGPTLASAASCVCGTGYVNIRSSPGVTSKNKIGLLTPDACLPFTGKTQYAGSHVWFNVDYNGQDGWIASNWLRTSSTGCSAGSSAGSSSGSSVGSECPRIISRSEWGAKPSNNPLVPLPATPKYMFIHHTAGRFCSTTEACKAEMRSIQDLHMTAPRQWSDIGYSFLVGEDGNVYEGRGWNKVGAHTYGYNSVGLAISFMGNFMDRLPNDKALNAAKQLISCSVAKGELESNYILKGHRDMKATACPGDTLYELITKWPHYVPN
ncbi:peptidoglycan recognition protein 1 [Lingula anatina]|uniref:Peptidoglycan recognition protein 1 n=1 Tax=Lingula anatina TaxID=7574 RepID=A0A1S3HA39_LINAN|nr:peptidoglycan recognition protein 1 [Lingula anatina]|eukprot:XP_013382873.1 peptidoglycan recognition protein 1 [Lingula anatina]